MLEFALEIPAINDKMYRNNFRQELINDKYYLSTAPQQVNIETHHSAEQVLFGDSHGHRGLSCSQLRYQWRIPGGSHCGNYSCLLWSLFYPMTSHNNIP